jgi:phosphoribulokinase
LVVPGGKMGLAMELILTPLIVDIMKKKSDSDKQLDWMSDM